MKLHIINKITADECINYVFATEDEAYDKFKELFIEGEELDGDSLIECFEDYKGARFEYYRVEYHIVEFGREGENNDI